MNMNCHSESDESQLVDAEGVAHYHMMTGSVNWAIVLVGRHDIQHAVSALLSVAPCNNKNHVVAPPYHHEGHHICAAVMTSISGYLLKNFPAKNNDHYVDGCAAKDCSVKRPEQEQVQATTSLVCSLMPLFLAARMIHIFI
jgi:hypothetical protein